MGWFSDALSSIDDAFQKGKHLIENPSEALALKEDLLTPRKINLDTAFTKADTVLDILDPMHNFVQTKTTGKSTTEGQSPYFQKIAPMIVDWFLPGAGSAAVAVSGVSDGNTKQVVQGAAGAVTGFYSTSTGAGEASFFGVSGQNIGKFVSLGAKAYAIYDASDSLMGYKGQAPVNMISTTQQATPIYSASQSGTPYGRMTGATGPGTNEAANAAILAAYNEAESRKTLAIIGVALAGLYFLKGK